MAPIEGHEFADQWPELADRLARSLSARGVSRPLQEDIIQETGLRLFAMWDRVDQTRGAWPLAVTIAKNLLWDDVNRRQKREVLGEVADHADSYDVERAGMARVELGRIRRALPALSKNHRVVLLTEVGEPADFEGTPRSVKMLRMRARKRLIALLDRASALGIAVAGSVRSFAWKAQRNLRHEGLAEGYGAIATFVAAAIVGTLIVAADAPQARADETPTVVAIDETRAVVDMQRDVKRDRKVAASKARRDSIRTPGARRTRGDAPKGYSLGFGDGGPADGEIRVELLPGGRGTGPVKVPSCTSRVSRRSAGVVCEAEADAREATVRVKARVRARINELRP